jgi:hypothetical protein
MSHFHSWVELSRTRPEAESRPGTVHPISGFSFSFAIPEIHINF